MKHVTLPIIAAIAVLWALPAAAMDFHQARAQGLVGEKLDGYTAPVSLSAETQAISEEVNSKRKQEYSRISQQNGQPVDVVAKLAAGQIIGKLEAGAMYQDASGNWKKK